MPRSTTHYPARLLPLLAAALFCCVPAWAQAVAPDPTTAAVAQAERLFSLSILREKAELTTQINAVLDREIQRAADRGDLDALEPLQAQLDAYEQLGTLPDAPATRSHVQQYQKQITRLGDDLIKAYESALRSYTQARDIDNARLMQSKINWTRPTTNLDTVEHKGHLYLLVREKKSWTKAKADCEALAGTLACLNNRSEHRFIVDKLTKGQNLITWIGGTDAHQEGDWVWLDGSAGYWPWNKNEPNNVKRRQHYASLNKSGTLSDLGNNDKRVNEWNGPPTCETLYQPEERVDP